LILVAAALVGLAVGFLLAAALVGLAVGFLLQQGGTVSPGNPPLEDGVSVVRGFTLAPGLEKAAKPDPSRCIFVEHGIGPGCRYDDRFLAKVGRDGVKAYGSAEVSTDDNIGN
jgi:hypothetical protein